MPNSIAEPPAPPSGAAAGTLPAPRRGLVLGKKADWTMHALALAGAAAMLLLLALLVGMIFSQSLPAIRRYGWGFLVSTHWNPVVGQDRYGVLQFVYGTFMSSFLGLLIAVPVSLGSAIMIVRIAPKWLSGTVSFLVELLAAVPSIAYGLWGALIMVPWLQNHGEPWLKAIGRHIKLIPVGHYRHHKIEWFPANLVHGGAYGADLLAGGLILALMITPIITAVTRDVLRAVPPDLEQGAYGLGATWWQATRVVLGYSSTGIYGAIILGFARAVGETMAIIMVIGNSDQIKLSLFASAQTMAGLLANEFTSTDHTIYRAAVFYVGLVLLMSTLIMNTLARLLVMRVTRRKAQASGGKRAGRNPPPSDGPPKTDLGPAEAYTA